jgi:hypothetical protein
MHQTERVIVTIIIILNGTGLCTIGRRWFRWMADPRWWSFGESNWFRRLTFNDKGDIRRVGVVVLSAIMLAMVWLLN